MVYKDAMVREPLTYLFIDSINDDIYIRHLPFIRNTKVFPKRFHHKNCEECQY